MILSSYIFSIFFFLLLILMFKVYYLYWLFKTVIYSTYFFVKFDKIWLEQKYDWIISISFFIRINLWCILEHILQLLVYISIRVDEALHSCIIFSAYDSDLIIYDIMHLFVKITYFIKVWTIHRWTTLCCIVKRHASHT